MNAGPDATCITFPNIGEVRVVNDKNKEKTWEFDEVNKVLLTPTYGGGLVESWIRLTE
jgi:hypothetical protein